MNRPSATRLALGCCIVGLVLAGCAVPSGAPSTGVAASTGARSTTVVIDGEGQHRGRRPGTGSASTGSAAWPSDVPLPPAQELQLSASPGQWSASGVLPSGLTDSAGQLTGLYQRAGYALRTSGPGLLVLADPHHTVTVTLTAEDHDPGRTRIGVRLSET